MGKILVLEDEESIRSFIVINLKRAGYDVVEAVTGEEAIALTDAERIDVALLDVMLPGIDGFGVCRHIREHHDNVGIIMLTAKAQEADKVHGLTIGADDYVLKPFSPVELVARVGSLMRRIGRTVRDTQKEAVIEAEPFRLFLDKECITKDGVVLELTPLEYSLAKHMLMHKNTPLSRHELLDNVWGETYVGDPKIVDVNIRRLRRKVEDNPSKPKYIETFWGRGYMWHVGEK
ncbi:response regulator transcription factor [Numidum massiliense]|uniref:response regulator transcription factor n=1 Tax=Numidum massiliense TaxID=1522315 RepID=UPI0006D5A75A|nr:response regulator transcription factor [Numidum massiliense]